MRSIAYKHYLLGFLTVLVLFNYVDRLALGMVLQDVKVDLDLTDTQLGFLSGIAFAVFYSIMGIPIARWADRGNRAAIISVTTVLWSLGVALCGWATSFAQLLLIRIGVAVGEAGCIPPALSLIADYFNRAERPRAAAIYGLGGPLSYLIGFFLAGWLNELYGWRKTFMLLGAPGLVFAAVAWLTLREPRREKSTVSVTATLTVSPSPKEVVQVLSTNRTFRHLLLCQSVLFFFGYGILLWQPAFFIRSYGLTTATVGTWLAVVYGLGGLVGAYLGGELAARHAAHNESRQLKGMALALIAAGAVSICIYLSPNPYWAFALAGLAAIGLTAPNGPFLSTIQTLVPERMRAMAFALVYLFANLIGMGLGPLAAGALSDVLRPWVGEESLRYVLLILAPGYFWGAWHAWRASKTVTADLASVSDHREGTADEEHRVGNSLRHRVRVNPYGS